MTVPSIAQPSARRGRRFANRFAAVLFGILFAVLLAEIAVRLLFGSLPAGMQTVLRFVRVTPFTDQRLAPLPLYEGDRDYQTIMRPGAHDEVQVGSMNVRYVVSTYNWWGGRVGFRSPQPETGRVDAVALGDSFTVCIVDLADCWVTLLGAHTGIPFLNMGQLATGSLSHARLFWDFVAKPELGLGQPKIVLWQFFGNDYNDDFGLALVNGTNQTLPPADSLTTNSTWRFAGGLDRWLAENSAVYALVTTMSRVGNAAGLYVDPYHVQVGDAPLDFGQPYVFRAFDMSEARNLEGEQISHQAILDTRDIVEDNGGVFVVVLVPTKEEVYRRWTEPQLGAEIIEGLKVPRLRLMDFCAANNLTCFDVEEALKTAAEDGTHLYYKDDMHLNPAGNRVLADALAAFLDDEGILAAVADNR
jgi:hypothetical protein